MKPSPDKSRAPVSPPSAVPDHSFYEHHWDGPKRVHVPVWQPRLTTIVVVFEGVSRHLFSAVRILLYSHKGSMRDAQSNVWDIQQLGPAVRSLRPGHAQRAPPNPSSLPKLTVAFEVSQLAAKTSFHALVLRSPASTQDLDRRSFSVLLRHELPLTSDTTSVSLSFTHSTLLWTSTTLTERQHVITNPTFRIEHVTTRIVRVLPPDVLRPRVTNGSLPTELLIKTFEDAEFRDSWHDDLLSFAQVCRAWSCAMEILHARLSFSDDDKQGRHAHLLDLYVLANALSQKPLLGHGFRHLTTINFRKSEEWQDILTVPRCKHPLRFTLALIAILRTTKNLQLLHLGQLDPDQSDALFAVLHALRDVHTFSIGQAGDRTIGSFVECSGPTTTTTTRMLSVVQLARCMGRWPALTSLKLHHLHPGSFGIWRFALRPPACRLTQLTLSQSHVSDRDLVHLFASSAKTLEHVVLDRLEGVTNAGLAAFLLAIAQNVVYLTVQDVALPPFRQWGSLVVGRTERALDVVVDKMPRLSELRIGGDVASEFMLDRRSKMYVAREGSEETRVPVVWLWFEDVPRLCGFMADRKWPGWATPAKAPRR